MKLIIFLAILLAIAGPIRADSKQDLVSAIDAFESVKVALSSRVNTLSQDQRTAIWTQYYLALENLQRMDIHQRMMAQHNEDRSEQFHKAHSEFTIALEELHKLLPAAGG